MHPKVTNMCLILYSPGRKHEHREFTCNKSGTGAGGMIPYGLACSNTPNFKEARTS